MIKSMTGFGRCEVLKDSRKFTGRIKKCESQISRCKHSDAEEIEFFRDVHQDAP